MNFDPITLDEVRRQAEATRADVAASAAQEAVEIVKSEAVAAPVTAAGDQ